MPFLQKARERLTDERLRAATLAGAATIPFTVVLSLAVAEDVAGTPLFVAGLFVGYHYADRATPRRTAGVRTGLAGSIGVVAVVLSELALAASAWIDVVGAAVLAAVLVPLTVLVGVGLAVLVGVIGAIVGDWLTARVDRERAWIERAERAYGRRRRRRRLLCLGLYVLLTPAILGYALGVRPEAGAGFALSVLALFLVVPLGIAAYVALVVDAAVLRTPTAARSSTLWAAAGAPLAAAVLLSLAASVHGSASASGIGTYGFLVGLWLTALAYLGGRYRAGDGVGDRV